MILWSTQYRRTSLARMVAALMLLISSPVFGGDTSAPLKTDDPFSLQSVQSRLRDLETSQRSLIEQNQQLSSRLQKLSIENSRLASGTGFDGSTVPPAPSSDNPTFDPGRLPFDQSVSGPASINSPSFDTAEEFPREQPSSFLGTGTPSSAFAATFDRGFVIRPTNSDETPFELKINGQNQFRYAGFERDDAIWTDSAGVTTPINNMSSFQIPRGRLIFSGYSFRKELLYNLNIDYNTVGNSQINFRAYWLAWRFSRSMTVYAGQSKVPGSREWLASFVDTLGVDRSMATTFFRPSLSQGVWATGEPAPGLFYHVMMSNGFNTLGATPQQLSSLMAFSGSVWWEPLGEFGRGYSDFECHTEPAIRLGTSLTYAPERGPQGGSSVPENSDIRLSDGTLITETGALAPGVTLNAFKIGLATFDVAYKYRGASLSGEFFSQDLFELTGSGPLPRSSIRQYGGFAQAGYFVIPQKLEPYARTSFVTGPNGTGSEYAGGFNWFLLPGKQNLRFTLDAAWLNHCSADQNRTNLQAGQTGILVRSQLQIFF
ncbi:MAG: porin [Planctomycetota bacterium]